MKKISTFVLTSLLFFGMIFLAACNTGGDTAGGGETGGGGSTGGGSGNIDIGIILPSTDLPRWMQDEQRFLAALEGSGYNVEILFSQDSSSVERQNVETFITRGARVIILGSYDGGAAAAAAQAARDAGVYLIAYDRLITGTDAVDFYVTFDSIAVGEAMGRFLADRASDMGGSGHPLYLFAGHPGDNNAFLFFEGAWNILQPRIADGTFVIQNSSAAIALQDTLNLSRSQMSDIIQQITTNWLSADARNLAEANLTAAGADGKGVAFVLAPNDGTALAISDAFLADPDISGLYITGQDAEVSSVQGIIDGRQSMTVFKDVRMLVSDTVALASELLAGGTPQHDGYFYNQFMDVPSKLSPVIAVDINNLREILIYGGYYDESLFEF